MLLWGAEQWHFLPHLMLVTEHSLTCWGVDPYLFLSIWTSVVAIKKFLYGAVILRVALWTCHLTNNNRYFVHIFCPVLKGISSLSPSSFMNSENKVMEDFIIDCILQVKFHSGALFCFWVHPHCQRYDGLMQALSALLMMTPVIVQMQRHGLGN